MLETVVVAKNCYSLLVLDQMASSLNSADIVKAIATIAGAFQSNQVGGQQLNSVSVPQESQRQTPRSQLPATLTPPAGESSR